MNVQYCTQDYCNACDTYVALLRDGAAARDWWYMEENGCELLVVRQSQVDCPFGLKLDPDDAEYRKKSKAETMRMCDIAILGRRNSEPFVIAIELKSGVAYEDELEQLVQGLNVLYQYSQHNSPNPCITAAAYFVVGREGDKLRFAVRDKLSSLRFGPHPVRFDILDCGTTLKL